MIIGKSKIIISETLLIPDGEFAKVFCNIAEGDDLNIKITFSEDAEHPEQAMDYEFQEEEFIFKFKNFKDPLGTNNLQPIHFANSNAGEPIRFFSVCQRLSGLTKIVLQVMLEEKNG